MRPGELEALQVKAITHLSAVAIEQRMLPIFAVLIDPADTSRPAFLACSAVLDNSTRIEMLEAMIRALRDGRAGG